MKTNENETPKFPAAADTPQPPMLDPDEAIAELQAFQARIPDFTELTLQEREYLRRSARISEEAIQASFGVLDVSGDVAQIVGQPENVRQLHEKVGRWTTFEREVKAMLQRVVDANIVRRQRLRLMAVQAYLIAQQYARTPGNAGLETHVKEVRRLRASARRRKASPPPDPGTPSTSTT